MLLTIIIFTYNNYISHTAVIIVHQVQPNNICIYIWLVLILILVFVSIKYPTT